MFMRTLYEYFPPNRGYWKIAPGPNARIWPECFQNGYIAVGWPEVGDLTNYSSLEELKRKFQELWYTDSPQTAGKKAKELWNFYNLKPGDRVLANDGQARIVGVGTVTDEGYRFRDDLDHYKHTVGVRWDKDFQPKEIPPQKDWFSATVKALPYQAFMELTADRPKLSRYTPDEEAFFHRMELLLEQKGQLILYGPPGTGKTYLARKFVEWIQDRKEQNGGKELRQFKGEQDNVELVTFHPSFNYEDFIEGFKPTETGNGQIAFRLEQGIFVTLCHRAENDRQRPYFLIIDEINRGNVAKIFGELLTVLEKDKREKVQVRLPQSKNWFAVPPNIYIIATMNTADRSIKLLDAALKRRFAFVEILPDPKLLDVPVENTNLTLADIMNGLNAKLRELVGRDKQIGHAYFMRNGAPVVTVGELKQIYQNEIIPLIQEYCYDNYQQLAEIVGSDFVDPDLETINEEIFAGNDDDFTLALINRFSTGR